MNKFLWLSLIRYLKHHPWQLALSICGVALGVAVVLAVDIANASARAAFSLARQQLAGAASHQIVGTDGAPFAEAEYRELRRLLAGVALTPVVAGYVADTNEPGRQLQLLGFDPFAASHFDSYLGTGSADLGSLRELLLQPGAAFLPAAAGSFLDITSNGSNKRLVAAGTLDNGRFEGLIVTDIAQAQALLGRQGQLSYVALTPATDTPAAIAALTARLPPGLTLREFAERDRALGQLSASFSLNLTALSLLALMVGMFLIYNTMTFTVLQRRRLLGLLRALGASKRELFACIVGEALLLGAAGTALGILLGTWLGRALVGLVTRTVSDLYYVLTATAFSVTPLTLGKALVLGLLATVGAALLPALEAARAPPGAAISRAALESRWQRLLPRMVAAGFLLLLLAALALQFTNGLIGGFAGLFLVMIGCALLAPLSVQLIGRWLGSLAPEPVSAMALRGLGRQLSRTGVAVAALMVAFAATIGVDVMVTSFRSGVENWLQQQLTADYYIAPSTPRGNGAALEPAVVRQLATTPGVAAVSFYRWVETEFADRPTLLGAAAMTPRAENSYRLLAGDSRTAWDDFKAGTGVVVSEPFAYRHRLDPGDRIELATADGPHSFAVAGVFHDFSTEHGRILVSLDRYRRLWRDDSVSTAAIETRAGTESSTVRLALERTVGRLQPIAIRASGEIRGITLDVFDRTFTITRVLKTLAVVVAVLGMLGALLALNLERTREFAVLRALGMSRTQVGALAWAQSGLLGLIAGLLAVPVGLLLAALLIFVINRRAFGWTLPFSAEASVALECIVLATGAALLAGAYPMWRLRRVIVGEELRGD